MMMLKVLAPLLSVFLALAFINVGLYLVLPPPTFEWVLSPARSYRLEFDQTYLEGGRWYGPESDSTTQMTYKWTGSPRVTLRVPLIPISTIRVRFRVYGFADASFQESLQVSANGMLLELTRETDAERIYSALIPYERLRPETEGLELAFAIPYTVSAQTLNPAGEDDRILGMALDWLTVQAITDGVHHFEFDELSPVEAGWYGTEVDARTAETFRWTKSTSAQMTLPLPPDKTVRLELGVLAGITSEVLDSLRLVLNGTPLVTERSQDARGTWIYRAEIPPQGTDSALLEFQVDAVYSPLELGTGADERLLGVNVDWLHLTELAQ